MICPETGYNDTLECECVYHEATDETDAENCAIHADAYGTPHAHGAACCERYTATGRHDDNCGNVPWETPTAPPSIPWTWIGTPAPSRPPAFATIGNGLYVRTRRAS